MQTTSHGEAGPGSVQDNEGDIHAKRVLAIREEMKFEVGILHDRVNALVSAEAFLIISFTMSLAYTNDGLSSRFFVVAPLLALVGFLLAVLAWPGVNRGVTNIVEWNILLIAALKGAQRDPNFVWRPSVDAASETEIQGHHRKGMLFARFVPAVFAVAWVLLAIIVLTGPMRRL